MNVALVVSKAYNDIFVPLVKLRQKSNSLQKCRIHKTVEPTGDASCSYFAFSMKRHAVRRFSPATSDALCNAIFSSGTQHFSKEIKVNGEKRNRQMRWPYWTVDTASCKLVVTTCPRDTLFTSQMYAHNCQRCELVSERKLNVWTTNVSATKSRGTISTEKNERKSQYLFTLGALRSLYFSPFQNTKIENNHDDKRNTTCKVCSVTTVNDLRENHSRTREAEEAGSRREISLSFRL